MAADTLRSTHTAYATMNINGENPQDLQRAEQSRIVPASAHNLVEPVSYAPDHMATVTPVSPSPAQVKPLNAGTSSAMWLNKPSMLASPAWPVTRETSSCRNSHSGRASPGGFDGFHELLNPALWCW